MSVAKSVSKLSRQFVSDATVQWRSLLSAFGYGDKVYKLPDHKLPGVVQEALEPFELIGENWFKEEALPIAILWGFNPWKRPYMQAFFPEHKLAFVRGGRSFIHLKKFVDRLPNHQSLLFVAWGTKMPLYGSRYARRNSVPLQFVEDGFLRSFHPGALHTRPFSLAVDSRSPYYDTNNTTDLQIIIDDASKAAADAGSQRRAEAGISLIRAASLTKYYSLKIEKDTWAPPPAQGKKVILVVGQVEDDAAIRLGYNGKFSNYEVVKQAVKDHPDARVLYRPHPDTFYNGRKSKHEKKISRLCTVVEPTVALHSIFPHVDHVYVGTSLVGLEAAIYGLPVTAIGRPFYAASAQVSSLQGARKQNASLSVHALFQAVYLDYPKYVHPDSEEAANFFDVACYFIVEKYKHLVLDGIPPNALNLAEFEASGEYLTPPAKLFIYLLKLGRLGKDDPEYIVGLAGDTLRYEDIPQFSDLLIKSCRFDSLALYLSRAVEQFTRDMEMLKYRKALTARVLETFIDNEKILRGRVEIILPDVADWIAPKKFAGYAIPDELLLAYARALSNNLQYDVLETIVFNMESSIHHGDIDYSVTALRAFTALLSAKPARSERNAAKRAELMGRISRLYHEQQLAEGDTDPLFARAFVDMAVDAPHACNAACKEILARLEVNADVNEKSALLLDFQKRSSQVSVLVSYLTRQSMHDTVDRLMSALESGDSDNRRTHLQRLRILVERGEFAKFHALYASVSEEVKARPDVNDLYIRALSEQGDFLSAQRLVQKNIALTNISRRKRSLLYEQHEKLAFSLEASRILDTVPQPHLPKGVVFLGAFTDYKAIAMLAPVLMEVRKRGYAVISLINGVLQQTPTGLDFIDKFIGSVPANSASRRDVHKNEWYIHWDKKIVSCEGVNYYQGFYEALSNFFRKYAIDLNDEAIRKNFFYRLVRADDSLDVCNRIYWDVVRQGLPTIILSGDGHVVPHSIFRDFCRARNHPLLSYVNVNIGYENYFTNLGGRFSSTMTVTDHTMFPHHRAPFLARADRFEKWYSAERNNQKYQERASQLINVNRVHAQGDDTSRALVAYLNAERVKGRKIVCCLGKIPIDLGVPYDGGPAHEDLKDWLNHTIESLRGHDDVLLLVKPHPHEIQPSIALDLLDGFVDLIEGPLPENVRILGHREINNHQLAPCLDLALMWNGSSAAELTALGVPVMMASYFGKHDYPVELLYPNDRFHYQDFISSGSYPVPDEETRRRAAYLIAYLETSDVTIRNDYAWRPVTNDSVGVPTWRPERIEQLLKEGDPEMVRAASRILERFEGPCN